MRALNERRTGGRWRVGSMLAATPRLAAVALLLAGCDECVSDDDCDDGQVCEVVSRGAAMANQNQCVTGCHEDSQCSAGERCEEVVCITTPCPGQCVAGADECSDDSDCASGSVCELSTGCEAPSTCVPGCHDASQCGAGESCRTVECFTCPCPGICEAGPSACSSDADCGAGFVCELSTGCEQPSQCVAGCRADAECPDGLHCLQPQCFTCPCPGFCAE
jgi:Cys-rich repeat protein